MRRADRIEDRARPVTMELDFEDPIWRVEGGFCAFRYPLTAPKQSLFRSNRFLILASSKSMLLSIRRESARGPDACSPRGNAPSDQLAPDGRLPGTAAPSLDTQAEER